MTNVAETPIHIHILKEELGRRVRKNPSYSLRAFAKHLDIDPSLLSKILKNKRKLSPDNAVKIIENIKVSKSEKRVFWESYINSRENLHKKVNIGHQEIDENLLEHKYFNVIAEPYHYAIVELFRITRYQNNFNLIAVTLGLSLTEVKTAINNLLDIGMLKMDGDQIRRNNGRFTTKDKEITSAALKYHQRKILEKAAWALDEIPLSERSQNSMTIAINTKKVPLVKKMFEDFINQVSDVLETDEVEEVYQMSFSLFPFYSLNNQTEIIPEQGLQQ